jgi:adenylate cyclase
VSLAIQRLDWQEQEQAATRVSNSREHHRVAAVNQCLRLQYGPLTLDAGPNYSDVWMGRAEENHIAVLNDEASRQHAQILYRRCQFLLHDLSTNGTYVKKEALQPFLVRRDSIVLDGKGILSLGVLPDESANEIVQFELIQD